ncbi:MAG: UbiA family prenyltransferase, partial [Silvanigrellaceae bacterium]|nr:UbiA family prenyltransferase [Silvanigrellaceae bacterium]
LAYKGLGELFVLIFFGFAAVGGVFFLQTAKYTFNSFVGGLQVGLLASVLISINNLRDTEGDQKANKKTLAVRFGKRFALWKIFFLFFFSYALQFYWFFKYQNLITFLPMLTLPIAYKVINGLVQNSQGFIFNKFLAMSAGIQMIFGILMSIALFFC